MLSWQWPYVFALIPLPLVVRWLTPPLETAAGAIRVPFYQAFYDLDDGLSRRSVSNWLRGILLWLIWLSLLVAAARPTWIGDPVNIPQDRRDLMLAVDISGSMREQDMLQGNRYVDRISAVKEVVGEFVELRGGDRLGLILFGRQGYLQTPLTYDSHTVKQQLDEAQLGFAGDGTAIGDTIGLAVKRLRDRPADSRVLILLTDGANNTGTDPARAADIAAEAQIRIHTIGVGAEVKQVRDIFGRSRNTNPSRDLDEATLQAIADKTGGKYFRARDPKELTSIYAELDRLEPIPEEQTFRPTRSLSHWAVIVALLLSSLLALGLRRST
ncbi:MAG: VWA domain-containing protein [Pseudomonadota bacterium]